MQKPTHRNFKRRPKRYAHPVDAKVGDRFPCQLKNSGSRGKESATSNTKSALSPAPCREKWSSLR